MEEGVEKLGFEILGNPKLGILAFSHPELDVYAIYKSMYLKGWFASLTTQPKALHLMLSPFHHEVIDAYLGDLVTSLAEVKAGKADGDFEARYS